MLAFGLGLACSGPFWKKMESVFTLSSEDVSYLKRQVTTGIHVYVNDLLKIFWDQKLTVFCFDTAVKFRRGARREFVSDVWG